MATSPSSPSHFTVSRMTLSDYSEILRPRNRRGGDLTTPPLSPQCWFVADGDDQNALRRLEYSTLRERKFFQVDPTCHSIKASAANGEIAAIARWNFFPTGYDFERHEVVNVDEFLPGGVVPEEFKIDSYRHLRTGMMKLRREWHGKGPAWVLMSMVTRQCYRRQGAASGLIDWGLEKARAGLS